MGVHDLPDPAPTLLRQTRMSASPRFVRSGCWYACVVEFLQVLDRVVHRGRCLQVGWPPKGSHLLASLCGLAEQNKDTHKNRSRIGFHE